jgi:hypothetical protein
MEPKILFQVPGARPNYLFLKIILRIKLFQIHQPFFPGKCFTPRPEIDVCAVQFLPRLEPQVPASFEVGKHGK